MRDEPLLVADEDDDADVETSASGVVTVRLSVPEESEPVRVDKLLAELYPQITRTRYQKLLDDGRVTRGGIALKRNSVVEAGEALVVCVPAPASLEVRPVAIPLTILYEDKHLVAVDKPAGMVVHPGAGTGEDTLVHALMHHCRGQLSGIGGVERPGIVHRLDKETSGVIVVAKSDKAHQGLAAMFAARDLEKRYLALVNGHPRLLSGTINEPIGRDSRLRMRMTIRPDGREARTDWELVEKVGPRAALLLIELHTGRTHQIRVHLSHLGHSLVGDLMYAGRRQGLVPVVPGERFYLHASSLDFAHPVSGKAMTLKSPLPADFMAKLAVLRGPAD